jgi:hypothetical protein
MVESSVRPVPTYSEIRGGLGNLWAFLALCFSLWILSHLPVGVASRLLVTGASLVCLAVSAFEVFRGVSDSALDRRTRQQILQPILSDIQYELNKARTEPIGEAATWILARGIWSLSTAVALRILMRLIEGIAKLFRLE